VVVNAVAGKVWQAPVSERQTIYPMSGVPTVEAGGFQVSTIRGAGFDATAVKLAGAPGGTGAVVADAKT
jgi:hypothetical protein